MADADDEEQKKWYEREQDEETKKKLADTNMENYGGKEHRDKQRAIAQKQKEWQGCGEGVGVEVWRIEKFKVIKQKDFNEKFYNGDSYIILHSYKEENKEDLKFNVHFWLGKHTSQDEAGAAAIKTVEVDDYLGDLPVQYRQVQGHETKNFLDLWESMQILEGGVDSGFRKVGPKKWVPRLLHVEQPNKKKKKKIKVDEVPLNMDSLNNCDAFVLDAGTVAFDFRPPKASRWEIRAANEFVNKLKSERGKLETHIVEWGDSGKAAVEFWGHFGIEDLSALPESLPDTPARVAKEEAAAAALADHKPAMYHVTDETDNGEVSTKLVKELADHNDKFDRQILKDEDDDCLVIDCGDIIYAWIGSTANKNEIKHAMLNAQNWLYKSGRPIDTPIVRIISGGEPSDFWTHFG